MVLNAITIFAEFTLPETAGGREWSLLVDTNLAEIAETSNFVTGDSYGSAGRSVLLFALRPDASSRNSYRRRRPDHNGVDRLGLRGHPAGDDRAAGLLAMA
jgi:hypothetical protein